MEKNQKVETPKLEEKEQTLTVRKTLTSRQYRAFLVSCYDFQNEALKAQNEELDKMHNMLRHNSNSRSVGKQIRKAIHQQEVVIKDTKTKIIDIQISLNSLDQFEQLNKMEYKLTEDYIAEERKRYFKDENSVQPEKPKAA